MLQLHNLLHTGTENMKWHVWVLWESLPQDRSRRWFLYETEKRAHISVNPAEACSFWGSEHRCPPESARPLSEHTGTRKAAPTLLSRNPSKDSREQLTQKILSHLQVKFMCMLVFWPSMSRFKLKNTTVSFHFLKSETQFMSKIQLNNLTSESKTKDFYRERALQIQRPQLVCFAN